MKFIIQPVPSSGTHSVRFRVLWPHRADEAACTIDIDDLPSALHLAAMDESARPLGVLSLFDQRSDRFPDAIPAVQPVYRLRAMGVLPEYRRLGVGQSLVEAACEAARIRGAHWLWCDAREVALPFYEALGFEYLSGSYDIPIIGPHRMMARRL